MEIEKYNDIHINEIRNEYKKIDNDWLLLHYKISIGLVIFACIAECLTSLIVVNSEMLTTTVSRFVWKFIIVPSGLNFICIVIDTMVMKTKRFSQNQKIYTVSLIFVVMCFTLFTVHIVFTPVYFFFAVAIILTTIYAKSRLTCVTALTSIAALTVSEIFIKWDLDKISIFESTPQMGDFLISIFMLSAFSIVCMVQIKFERKKNEASIKMEIDRLQLKERLQLDELTGIFNRKSLHEAMRDMEENELDHNYIFAIGDIDNFKGVNDQWGHHVGDECLIEFARILNKNSKKSTVFRYGGDEFCLLFRNADMAEAVFTCEQIQNELKNYHFSAHSELKLTASFGLAAYLDQLNSVRLFIQADQALYEAKEARDTICVFRSNTK